MSIIAFAVRRWQLSLVFFLLVVVLGLQAFLTIPRSVDPHFPFAAAIVTAALPGADAAEIEESVAKPIEDVLQGLDNVDRINSTSSDGVAVIFVEFVHGTDAEQSLDRTIREVSGIRGNLPPGIARLEVRRPRPTEAAVLQLALVSQGASWRRMEKYASDLRDRLNVVKGVRDTTISGLALPELQVSIESGRLAETGLPATAVSAAIGAAGTELPGGAVHAAGRRFNVDTGGAYRSMEAVRSVSLRAADGRLLKVGDIATVDWGEAEHLHLTRYNGRRAVFIAVKQKDNASATVLRNALAEAADKFRAGLPPDIKLEIAFDQSIDIERRLGQLAKDFAIALALVLVTLLPLGLRASGVVMISIPLSLAMGVLMLSLFGYSLNQISISGFIISLGLLVDDSIVVTENIERHLRGETNRSSRRCRGRTRSLQPCLVRRGYCFLLSSRSPSCPRGRGDFVRGLPMAVIFTISSSLIVSLTIIPFVASRLLKREHPDGNRFLRAVNGAIERFYQPLLHRALDNPRKTLLAATIGCLVVFATVPLIGFSLFPASDSPYFVVRVEAPEGSGLELTDQAVRDASAVLAREPNVLARMDNVGRGNPQIYYNNIPRENDTRYGEVFVTLKDWDQRTGPQMIARLRASFDRYPDAKISVVRFENGPPVDAPVAFRVRGPEVATLRSLSKQVADAMRNTPGLRDIDDPLAVDRIDLDLGIDSGKANLLEVAPDAIRRTVRLALAGERASTFRDSEGDSYPVVVRLPIDKSRPVSALKAIYLPTLSGGTVPMSQLAKPSLKAAPAKIRRYELERFNQVTAFNEPGVLASRLNEQVVAKLERLRFPPGYSWEVAGAAEVASRNTAGLGGIVLLAVFGIFGVLVIEFGRFRDVTVVAGVVPLGLVGGLAALLLTGNSLSFLAVIGFVALVGIEIKNSILLVDFTTRLRARGLGLREAIEKAGEIRFLPVLLTSVTAIGGLLPLAWSGSPLYSPLAWVIIGGLVSSTLLSRIVTPVMYLLVARNEDVQFSTITSGVETSPQLSVR